MLKRIFIIALFTGAGQLFVVFALKYISQHSSDEQLRAIAQIDSLVLFLINVIALGLQPAAMRNLALNAELEEEYKATQSARLTLGLMLAMLIVLSFFNKYYLAFLVAPLLALSGDYALYGRGLPVTGAVLSFLRSVVPFLLLILFVVYQPQSIAWIYLVGLLFSYLFTNILIANYLKAPFFSIPRWHSLKLYINTLSLGLVSLGLYFIGMGVILIAPYFYNDTVVATAFVGLKFYVIFKGVLRIIQQAFLKEMVREDVGLKVDQISTLLGLSYAAFIICFPDTFIRLFFGVKYLPDKSYFILLGIAALIYSLFSSFTTRAMLGKKDNHYARTAISAAFFTLLVCIVLSFVSQNPESIGVSIVVGEIFFAAGMLLLMKKRKYLPERIIFLLRNIFLVIIPLGIAFFSDDKLIPFSISFVVYSLLLISLYFNKFKLPD
jgi:O-antigen/teichoic acid export membrane protein